MILVDTSIWIDYINKGFDHHLSFLLEGESVVMHPFILGEIAMGSLKDRTVRLAFFRHLHTIAPATDVEVATLIESGGIHGTGLSYIDAHLLAAARASADFEAVRIWTGDKRLHAQAERLGVAYADA